MTDKTLAPGGSSQPAGRALTPRTEDARTSEAGAETVRDLAQAITDGEAFTDADAVRVARAYLDEGGETA